MNRILAIASAAARGLVFAGLAALPCATPAGAAPPEALVVAETRPAASAPADTPRWAPGEVLMRFRPAARAAQRSAALGAARASVVREYAISGVVRLRLDGIGVEEAVARLAADPQVAWAEPNYVWSIERTPNDTRYSDQWALANHGQFAGTPGADIRAEAAWNVTTGDSNVVVGVIDTGVDLEHPDLVGNLWVNPGEIPGNGIDDEGDGYVDDVNGWDFVNGDADPRDDHGHGTHVSGIIAAVGDNALGITGVCWRTKIMALKFLGAGGSGFTSDAVDALEFAIAHGVRITNNSWGGGPYSQALADAITAAGAAGMLVVVASGNSGFNLDSAPGYPACYPNPEIISVGATDKNDALAAFSNYGLETVDLAAPGDFIMSLWPARRLAILSGTSMAAPHVAGAAALLLARNSSMSPLAMKSRLMHGARALPSLAGKCVSGGRLDLLRSVADPDTLAPGAATGLAVAAQGSNWLDLAWIAPGDDGATGTAESYDLRISGAPFDAAGFEGATRVQVPAPLAAGSLEHARVYGLSPLTTWWFAVRALDEFGNAGPVSEVVSGATLAPPRLSLSAGSLSASLRTGGTAEQVVSLTNDSPGVLDWHIPPAVLAPSPVATGPTASMVAAPERGTVVLAKGQEGVTAAAQALSAGGPDAFGYRWLDSDAPGGPGYAWVDIARPENLVDVAGDDALSEPVPLGFEFPFYGGRFTGARVCTNGFLSFEDGIPAYGNTSLPSGVAPGRLVAPLWDDLSFGFGVRRAYAWSDGARFVVSWIAVPRYADPLSSLTFQVVLEPSGEIRFQYRALVGEVASCTAGIQDDSRTIGLTVAANQPYVREGLAVRVVPLPRWVTASPDSGSLGPGESASLTVHFDAARLGTESLAAALHVISNDPAAPDTALPVALDVTGVPLARLHTPALDFGDVQAGRRDTLRVLIENAGGAPLALTSLLVPQPFEVLAAPHTLEAGAFEALSLVYAPSVPGTHVGQLAIATADTTRPLLEVALSGHAVPPPEIVVPGPPVSLSAANGLGPLASERTAAVVVENRGDSPLHWTAVALQGAAAVLNGVAAPPAPFSSRGPAVKGAAEPLGARGSGAPDAAGYRWIDSDAPGGPVFEWEEISGVGARLFGGADDSTRTAIPLPFAFAFYGDTFTTVNVCTNGWLSFSSGSTAFLNGDLPDTSAGSPRHLVAPWWDDLDLRPVGGPSGAFAWYDGEKFVVEWSRAAHFALGGPYTFQVLLWPDGGIDFQYLEMSGGTSQATVGIQNGDGTVGLRVAYNAPYMHDRLRVRVAKRSGWLGLDRTSGVTPAGGVDTLHVRVNTEGWEDGDFSGTVHIASDDPVSPLTNVPVSLHVGAVRAHAELRPARLGPVSIAPVVELEVTDPPGHLGFDLRTLTLAGVPARLPVPVPAGAGGAGPAATAEGREVAAFDAIALRARLAAGSRVPLVFAGEMHGGWVADTVYAEVERETFAAGPLPEFGALAAVPVVRAGTTIPLEWTAPEGAERVDVMHSADGGRSWTRLASTREPSWAFVPLRESGENRVELVAVRADTAFASWLSGPFSVVRREVPQVGPAPAPAALGLSILNGAPGRAPVRMLWSVPAAGTGRVTVHDLRGARVRTLAHGAVAAGTQLVLWDGRGAGGNLAPPGVYFVRAEASGAVVTRRVVLLK
jgi:subtilisin family serine protease